MAGFSVDGSGLNNGASKKRQRLTLALTTRKSTGDTEEKKNRTATLLDLDVIDCPVCFNTLTIPIYQCDNGHVICYTCHKKLRKKCATCSLHIGSRNRAMEQVLQHLRVPCPNSEFGCPKNVTYDERSRHLQQCDFTQGPCPFNRCNFTGSYEDIYVHTNAEHLKSLDMFECGNPVFIHPESGERVVLKEQTTEGGRKLVVVECFTTPQGRIIYAYCIGPMVPRTHEFSYSLKLYSSNGDRLCFESSLKQVRQVSGEQPDEHFMFVPSHMCPDYKLHICINRKTY
ncbi:hypothetical protein EUTSA_v10006392mg [Eutrema salsugineum]|uniref:RING-type E3 ubiquitin transferase n=1 Tax=Eutrema salsugineum TaxID=72664 RepID=V4LLA3_EUTSA|nr:putative E3 ubiquitin-protein ligase SINA-like 9 [Eutrema salsugineum]ESQ44494.1 hypothetical protein EUTSA_v10006392mg [Eutrema salsugineum]